MVPGKLASSLEDAATCHDAQFLRPCDAPCEPCSNVNPCACAAMSFLILIEWRCMPPLEASRPPSQHHTCRDLTGHCACAAMSFLIPIGVVVYAAIGGLKATFTTSYMHTVIVFVLCLIFMFKVYVPGDLLGGIDDVSSPRQMTLQSDIEYHSGGQHHLCTSTACPGMCCL